MYRFETSPTARRRRQSGMSLVELLIASVILAVVFVGIVPLFGRAILSNKRGGDASRMSGFLNTSIEAINQISLNYRTFNSSFLTSDEISQLEQDDDDGVISKFKERARQVPASVIGENYTALPTTYWTRGARDSVTQADAFVGDEGWVTSTGLSSAEGEVLWLRDLYLYNYYLADVHIGTIDVGTQNTLIQQGHPKLFDSPQVWNTNNLPDIREVRVVVRASSSATPLGPGSLMAVSHFKAF
ncbi:MAG: prepilin-type N-terminal cleavage/methylation domain-containing protein [Acidobacteriota bacterium]